MGRIFLGFYILAPILIYLNVYNISVNKLFILVGSFAALYLLQYSRYKTGMTLEDASIGSAGYHLVLTDLVFSNDYNFDRERLGTFIDELKLFS